MKVSAFVLVLLGLSAVAMALHPRHMPESVYHEEWETFKRRFNKRYDAMAVEDVRYAIFKDNMDTIRQHNAEREQGKHSWSMGINQFGDLTSHEFRAQYLTFNPSQMPITNALHNITTDAPTSINWVKKGAVTDVKNQGQCGSCWAFSTCASIEGAVKLAGGPLESLSPQELVDCDTRDSGCNGGLMDNAFQWIEGNGGICSWTAYPYTAADGECKKSSCKNAAKVTGFTNVPQSLSGLTSAVASRPVSIAVDAQTWQFYSSGIYDSSCGQQLDHGVLAAGYGVASGKDYWLIKNSWGTTWGEAGYMQLIKGKNSCGIQNAASYPAATHIGA